MFWLVFWLAVVCVIGIFALLAGAAGRRRRKAKARQNRYRGSGSDAYFRMQPVRTGYAYRPPSYNDDEDEEDEDDYGDRVRATGTIIRHPHAIDPDDYECSVCGRRFPKEQAECPYCSARFTGRKTDDMEFLLEEDELEAWDEEEGC